MRKYVLRSAFVGLVCLAAAQPALADDHVVSSSELRQIMKQAAVERQMNREQLNRFFSSDAARKALAMAKIDPQQVQRAVAQISDEEAARLAAKAQKAEQDFAAGALTNQQITYILIALATAVVVLVLV